MCLTISREVRLRSESGAGRIRVTVSGPLQEPSGYVINVKAIDEVVNGTAAELLPHGLTPTESTALDLWERLPARLPEPIRLRRIEAKFPQLELAVSDRKPTTVLVTRQFEFSAAHRLHCESLTDNENRREFGKCVNFHGHNYVLEVTLAGTPRPLTGELCPPARFQQIVQHRVLDRFDHSTLNDLAEFADCTSTVENLANVVWNLLDGAFAGATLERIRIYETPRIWADRSRD